jgi:hypothetical protein
MWIWVARERVLAEVVAPLLNPDADEVRAQVCVSPVEHCSELLSRYGEAECQCLMECRSPGEQKSRDADRVLRTRLVWNDWSHADRHGHGCPSAPEMQHSGGADMTVAVHR